MFQRRRSCPTFPCTYVWNIGVEVNRLAQRERYPAAFLSGLTVGEIIKLALATPKETEKSK